MAVLAVTCIISTAVPISVPITGYTDVSLSGTGLSAELVTLDPGLAIFNMTFDGSEFDVNLLDSVGNFEKGLAFILDPFTGSLSKVVGIQEGGLYAIDIITDCNWTIDITQPSNLGLVSNSRG